MVQVPIAFAKLEVEKNDELKKYRIRLGETKVLVIIKSSDLKEIVKKVDALETEGFKPLEGTE